MGWFICGHEHYSNEIEAFFLSETIMANFTTKRPIAGMSAKVIEHVSSGFGIIFFAQVAIIRTICTHIFMRFFIGFAFKWHSTAGTQKLMHIVSEIHVVCERFLIF